jgi:hypothetical protein
VQAWAGAAGIAAREDVTISARATPNAVADAFGIQVLGILNAGASLADAYASPTVEAYAGGSGQTISGTSLTVSAFQLNPSGSDTAHATATGATGSLLLGEVSTHTSAINGKADDKAVVRSLRGRQHDLGITGERPSWRRTIRSSTRMPRTTASASAPRSARACRTRSRTPSPRRIWATT